MKAIIIFLLPIFIVSKVNNFNEFWMVTTCILIISLIGITINFYNLEIKKKLIVYEKLFNILKFK